MAKPLELTRGQIYSFLSRLKDDGNGCRIWTGCVTSKGYGQVVFNGEKYIAHRIAWQIENGPVPDGLFVCHHCDNPPCCTSSHLFLGTAADNSADMVAKGRHRNGR